MAIDRFASVLALAFLLATSHSVRAEAPQVQDVAGLARGTVAKAEAGRAGDAPDSSSRLLLPDYREPVIDSTGLPHRVVGYLQATFPGGDYQPCTATLVAPRTVLTAAHCLYSHQAGAWAEDILFAAGLNGMEVAPFGVADFEAAYVLSGFIDGFEGWYGAVMRWDLGVVILDQDIGSTTGWATMGAASNGENVELRLVGYYFDKPSGTMWEEPCASSPLPHIDGLLGLDRCWVQFMPSGAPLFAQGPEGSVLAGILIANSPEATIMLPLSPALIAWINGLAR